MWGLPIFHPRLHPAADGPALAVAVERELHRFEASGHRVWSCTLPPLEKARTRLESTEIPTREGRLSRLGQAGEDGRNEIRTGYLRLALDHRLNAGEAAVWEKLTKLLETRHPTESGATLAIAKFAIDSGYATPEVHDWTRKHGGGRAVVIKGDSRARSPVAHPSPIDVGPRGKSLKYGVRVWPVNGGMIKEELLQVGLDRPTEESGAPFPPGYCHFPRYGEEYFKQLTAEQLVARIVKGYKRPEWQKTRERNEGLDCRVYARAAAAVLGLDRFSEATWRGLEDQLKRVPEPAEQPQKTSPPPQRRAIRSRYLDSGRTGSWFDRW